MSGIMRAAARGARRLESSRVTSHARASIAPFHRIDGSEKSWNPSAAQIREPVGLPGMTFTPWGGVSDGEKISALEAKMRWMEHSMERKISYLEKELRSAREEAATSRQRAESLGVPVAAAHGSVGRVLGLPSGVTHASGHDAWKLAEASLRAPESAEGEHGRLGVLGPGRELRHLVPELLTSRGVGGYRAGCATHGRAANGAEGSDGDASRGRKHRFATLLRSEGSPILPRLAKWPRCTAAGDSLQTDRDDCRQKTIARSGGCEWHRTERFAADGTMAHSSS